VKFTWPRAILLAASAFSLIDSQIIPRNVDPGAHGDVMLFFVLGYRAVSKREPPLIVATLGALLTAFIAAVNRGGLGCTGFLCILFVVLVLLFILFWGRLTDRFD